MRLRDGRSQWVLGLAAAGALYLGCSERNDVARPWPQGAGASSGEAGSSSTATPEDGGSAGAGTDMAGGADNTSSGTGGTSAAGAGGTNNVGGAASAGGMAAEGGTDNASAGMGSTDSEGGEGPASTQTCAEANGGVCTPVYPCQDLAPPAVGYTCRGQFADWTPTNTPTSFIDNGDGTVSDANTGLLWQQLVDAGEYDWEGAKTYCTNLSLEGTGWRLPTRAELLSLIDFTVHPSVDTTFFPNMPQAIFWSSSPYQSNSTAAWFVASGGESELIARTESTDRYVRCVRTSTAVVSSTGTAGAPPARYRVDADGTVLDRRTGLTWQRAVDDQGGFQVQEVAGDHCASLPLAGGGWRLPNASELVTLVDLTQAGPAIDTKAFPDTPEESFWSSTGHATLGAFGWVVLFGDGELRTAGSLGPFEPYHRARCVR